MTLDTLVAGLLGAVVTIIVTRVLDLIQKSKEHKYSLQKLFFEKKLQAAEASVAE